jgi:orotate phosphoribosyltransferase
MIDPKLVYGPTAMISARAVFSAGAYLIAEEMTPENFYKWKSGILAPVYTDCRVIQSHPGPASTLIKALSSSIEANFPSCGAIVGMAEAGLFWSSPVSQELALPHAFVRKTKKDYGTGRMVEGRLGPDVSVVLVDDLMAGGGTAIDAINMIEDETGAHVIGVQTIVNWDFSTMRHRFSELGIPCRALVSFPQILEVAVSLGVITTLAASELKAFYRNPADHEFAIENLTPPTPDTGVVRRWEAQ